MRPSLRVKCLELSDVYQWSRELGYQDDEIEHLITLLGKRELCEVHQQHLLCELPSQAPDVEGVAAQLSTLEYDIDVLLKAFPGHNNLVAMENHAESWRQRIEEQLQTGAPDPELIYRLGQNIRIRQTELHNFANDERRNAIKQTETMLRGLRPVSPQLLALVERPIEGSVSYVDQVNALRIALQRRAQAIRGEVEKLRSSLEQSLAALNREDLRYEDLVAHVQSLEEQGEKLSNVNQDVTDLEQAH